MRIFVRASRGRRTRTRLTLAAVAVAALGLAACGSSANGEASRSPTQTLSDAQQATAAATSVKVSGRISSNGSPLALSVVAGQGNGGGTIVESGATFQLVLHGSDIYLRGPAATWVKTGSSQQVAQLLADKWLQTTTSDTNFGGLANLLDVTKLAKNLTPSGAITKGKTTTFNGTSVIPLLDHGQAGGTLYVAASGKPYIEGATGASSPGTITFSQYGSAVIPGVPAGAVSLQQLERGTT